MYKKLSFSDESKTSIQVELDDETIMSVPVAPGNRHYEEIKERGLEIDDYVPPVKSVDQKREEDYNKEGCSTDKLIVALWEKVIEGRPEEADRLQAIRTIIKEKYPKGE